MDRPQFTAWITKYALTAGIKEKLVEQWSEGMVSILPRGWGEYYHGEGKDWHRTHQGALERAEVMRVAKIASLKKQIAKLEKLRFE